MADAIAFTMVEKQHLIGFGDGLIASEMPDERAPIWEYQTRLVRGFFVAPTGMTTLAVHVTDCDRFSREETVSNNFRH